MFDLMFPFQKHATMEARFNEPFYNEVLAIYNERHSPARPLKMYGTVPRYNEPISLIPWHSNC